MIEVSITYEVVTPESAEHGDASERGFESESELVSFRELVGWLRQRFTEYSQNPGPYSAYTWATEYGDINFRDGSETSRSLHLKDKSKARYWVKALTAAKA